LITKKAIILTAFAVISCILQIGCNKDDDNQSKITVTDVDGNVYHTVKIGTQVWMVENLNVTHYRNGDPIPNVTDSTEWINLSTGAYCNYNNDTTLPKNYGRLYNWYAVIDYRNIAPVGWHVFTGENWGTLVWDCTQSLGSPPSISDLGKCGFAFYRAGGRVLNGLFGGFGVYAYFWSSTEFDNIQANCILGNDYWGYSGTEFWKYYGCSVRCVKD
jgi:uncharacterized protein (TIGR02145 family)